MIMGPWGIAGLIAIVAVSTKEGRVYVRKLFRTALRAGCQAKESAGELAGKAIEYKDEIIAEIKADSADETSNSHKKKKEKAATHHAE
jgi:hypothetical protein